MSTYYLLNPEVAGHFGDGTIIDHLVFPFVVEKLEYIFDGWMGDDLIESTPCFICSESLCRRLKASDLTGYYIDACITGKSALFYDLHPDKELPEFHWLRIIGMDRDDFRLTANRTLLVSERALELLKTATIHYCEIEPWSGE